MKLFSPVAAMTAAILSGDIAAFNDQSVFYPAFDGNVKVPNGSIFAANDANFDAEFLSQPLNDFIVGAPEEEGLLELLESIAPSVPVGRSFTYRQHDTKEQFQSDDADDGDIREIGGDFATIRRTGTQSDGRTDNKGLVMILDNDQGGEETAVQQRAVVNLRNRLLRSEIKRTITLLDTLDTNNNTNWGPSATGPDPDVDILTDIDAGGDARGVDSNIVLLGGGARIKRIKCLRTKTEPDTVGASLTNAQLADFLGADSVVTMRNRYQSSATAKSKILGDTVYSYYVRKGAMPDDASNIKRFVSMTPSGMLRVYVMQKLKRTIVAVEHYSRLIATSNLGVYKRTVTYT